MRRYRVSIKQLLMLIAGVAVALAMIEHGITSWGPLNLVVLTVCLLTSSVILACLPIIPHRPFWAGLALFGGAYALFCFAGPPLLGLEPEHRPLDAVFHELAVRHYGLKPNFKTDPIDRLINPAEWQRNVENFVDASHSVMAVSIGILGGCALLLLARQRESRRWDRQALPERPLEDFLLPPLKIEPPLQSK